MRKPFKKPKSIRRILTSYMLLLSAVLLLVISTVFSIMQYRTLRAQTTESLNHTAVLVADSVNQQINQMNQISLNAIGSTRMHEVFTAYQKSHSAYERNQLRLELAGILTNAKGFDFSIRQLNIYDTESGGFGIGEYNGDLPVSVRDLSWYEDASAASGRLLLAQPSTDPFLSSRPGGEQDRVYLSLCRVFFNSYHIPIGYAEVKKYYDTVFALADQPGNTYPASVVIFDADGRVLYPLQDQVQTEGSDSAHTNDLSFYYETASSGSGDYSSPVSGKREYIAYSTSEKYDLTVAVIIDHPTLLSRITRSFFWILSTVLLLLILSVAASVLLAHRISTPLVRIYRFLSDPGEKQFATMESEDTGILEVDVLHGSLNESIRSRESAAKTMVTLKEQEMQAQMLALQSQMNPHFLFNSLSTISAMAEEGLTEPVAAMSRRITEIMRYISSSREMRTSIEEELEICDMYLDCIRMRFGDNLQTILEVPDEMLECRIPKLCIQLLVENAVKFVTTQSPPWQIRVTGSIEAAPGKHSGDTEDGPEAGHGKEEKIWKITVCDNGPGFDPAVDKRLRSQMDEILATGVLPSLQIEGMGLLNIFIRLYLLDGIPFIFDMGNLPEGGAFVTVGGRFSEGRSC